MLSLHPRTVGARCLASRKTLGGTLIRAARSKRNMVVVQFQAVLSGKTIVVTGASQASQPCSHTMLPSPVDPCITQLRTPVLLCGMSTGHRPGVCPAAL